MKQTWMVKEDVTEKFTTTTSDFNLLSQQLIE